MKPLIYFNDFEILANNKVSIDQDRLKTIFNDIYEAGREDAKRDYQFNPSYIKIENKDAAIKTLEYKPLEYRLPKFFSNDYKQKSRI